MLRALGAGNNLVSQVLICLYLRLNKVVTVWQLIDFIWGADEEGGPDDAIGTIRVLLTKLRHAGFRIDTVYAAYTGEEAQRSGGYRLLPTRYIRVNVARFITTELDSYVQHSNFPILNVRKRRKLARRYKAGEPLDVIAASEAVTKRTVINVARAAGLRRRGHYTAQDKARIVARVAGGERFKTVAVEEKVNEGTPQVWLSNAKVKHRHELWYTQDFKDRILERVKRGDRLSVIEREEKISRATLYKWRVKAGLISKDK